MKNNYFKLFLISFFLLPIQNKVFSQIILKGKIIDKYSKKGIQGVNVYLAPNQGAVSNLHGEFELSVLETDELTLSAIGFERKTILIRELNDSVKKGKPVLIVMQPANFILDQVVISANKTEQRIKNATVSLEVIQPYLVQNTNTVTVDKILDQVPSVTVIDGQANIRGGSGWSYGAGSRVLVMLDQLPMLSPDGGQAQWAFIPIENLQNIEVIKGSSSVLFGSSALNGVINIRTATPAPKPETKVTLYVGAFDRPKRETLEWGKNDKINQGMYFSHAQKLKNIDLVLSGNYLTNDGYRMGSRESRSRTGWNLKYYSPKSKNWNAGINGNVQQGSSQNFLLWQNYDLGYTPYDSSYTTSLSNKFNLDPFFNWKKGDWSISLLNRYLRVKNRLSPDSTQSNQSDLIYSDWKAEKSIRQFRGKIIFGLTNQYAKTNSPLFSGNQNAGNRAAYLQWEQRFGKLNYVLGARYENYNLNDYMESKPVFRAGVNYELKKFSFLRASFGQGFRFPTMGESYITTTVGPVKIYPNPELKSESGWSAELGFKQGLRFLGINAFVDVALFWMEYLDMMEFTFSQWSRDNSPQNLFGTGFKSVNVGPSRIRGFDLTLNGEKKFKEASLVFLVGYSFIEPTSLAPERVFSKDSFGMELTYKNTSSNPEKSFLKYRQRHLIKADIQLSYKKTEIGFSYRFYSSMENIDRAFVTPPIDLFVKDIQKARDKDPNGVHVYDLRVSYYFNKRKTLKGGLVIRNLFNREYMFRPADIQAPRSLQLMVTYKL